MGDDEIQERTGWLRERRDGIGASDAASILGLGHDRAIEVYHRKRGELPDKPESLAMWLGHEMEPVIAKRYKLETGVHLQDPGCFNILKHPKHPWLFCTRDRTRTFEDGTHGPVELKAPGSRMSSEWSELAAPLGYEVQLQIQMACMGAQRGEIAAIVGNDKFYCIRYERNDHFLESIIPVLREFWEGVQNGTPPEVDGSESTRRAIRALHPNDNGESVTLPPEFEDDLKELSFLEDKICTMSLEAQQIKNKVMYFMGPNTFASLNGERVFTYKSQNGKDGKLTRVLRRVK